MASTISWLYDLLNTIFPNGRETETETEIETEESPFGHVLKALH